MSATHKRRPLFRWLCACGRRYNSGHLIATSMHPNDLARLRSNR